MEQKEKKHRLRIDLTEEAAPLLLQIASSAFWAAEGKVCAAESKADRPQNYPLLRSLFRKVNSAILEAYKTIAYTNIPLDLTGEEARELHRLITAEEIVFAESLATDLRKQGTGRSPRSTDFLTICDLRAAVKKAAGEAGIEI